MCILYIQLTKAFVNDNLQPYVILYVEIDTLSFSNQKQLFIFLLLYLIYLESPLIPVLKITPAAALSKTLGSVTINAGSI